MQTKYRFILLAIIMPLLNLYLMRKLTWTKFVTVKQILLLKFCYCIVEEICVSEGVREGKGERECL